MAHNFSVGSDVWRSCDHGFVTQFGGFEVNLFCNVCGMSIRQSRASTHDGCRVCGIDLCAPCMSKRAEVATARTGNLAMQELPDDVQQTVFHSLSPGHFVLFARTHRWGRRVIPQHLRIAFHFDQIAAERISRRLLVQVIGGFKVVNPEYGVLAGSSYLCHEGDEVWDYHRDCKTNTCPPDGIREPLRAAIQEDWKSCAEIADWRPASEHLSGVGDLMDLLQCMYSKPVTLSTVKMYDEYSDLINVQYPRAEQLTRRSRWHWGVWTVALGPWHDSDCYTSDAQGLALLNGLNGSCISVDESPNSNRLNLTLHNSGYRLRGDWGSLGKRPLPKPEKHWDRKTGQYEEEGEGRELDHEALINMLAVDADSLFPDGLIEECDPAEEDRHIVWESLFDDDMWDGKDEDSQNSHYHIITHGARHELYVVCTRSGAIQPTEGTETGNTGDWGTECAIIEALVFHKYRATVECHTFCMTPDVAEYRANNTESIFNQAVGHTQSMWRIPAPAVRQATEARHQD